ncbi:hypothetical protein HYDPIDRAFT_108721 [Hydnomerulius pinastri MD-312]|nr:hypothetical protein HYDPIDRAFT_108721 [Hydnomerulius pinastri MD-312]
MASDGFMHLTDEESKMLVQLASVANTSEAQSHHCLWTYPTKCDALIQGACFPEHLRVDHGVLGPDKDKLTCCWEGCFISMNKEIMVRHVLEKHLMWRYKCPVCGEDFSRKSTMQMHHRRHGA